MIAQILSLSSRPNLDHWQFAKVLIFTILQSPPIETFGNGGGALQKFQSNEMHGRQIRWIFNFYRGHDGVFSAIQRSALWPAHRAIHVQNFGLRCKADAASRAVVHDFDIVGQWIPLYVKRL